MKESQACSCSGNQIRAMGLIIPLDRAMAFLAWVSKFPSVGLKIPDTRSQKSLLWVSKFPSFGQLYPVYREIKMVLLCWPELMSVQFTSDIFAEHGATAAKTKFAPGPCGVLISAHRLDCDSCPHIETYRGRFLQSHRCRRRCSGSSVGSATVNFR